MDVISAIKLWETMVNDGRELARNPSSVIAQLPPLLLRELPLAHGLELPALNAPRDELEAACRAAGLDHLQLQPAQEITPEASDQQEHEIIEDRREQERQRLTLELQQKLAQVAALRSGSAMPLAETVAERLNAVENRVRHLRRELSAIYATPNLPGDLHAGATFQRSVWDSFGEAGLKTLVFTVLPKLKEVEDKLTGVSAAYWPVNDVLFRHAMRAFARLQRRLLELYAPQALPPVPVTASSLAAAQPALDRVLAASPLFRFWTFKMEHLAAAPMLTDAARGNHFDQYVAAYKRGLDLTLIRGRHKYYNLVARFLRQIHLLSEDELAWLQNNLSLYIAELGTRPLRDEAVEIHVVQKLKQALLEVREESAVRTGNRLDAVHLSAAHVSPKSRPLVTRAPPTCHPSAAHLSPESAVRTGNRLDAVNSAADRLKRTAFGTAKVEGERAYRLARRLSTDLRVADAMYDLLNRRLLPAIQAEVSVQMEVDALSVGSLDAFSDIDHEVLCGWVDPASAELFEMLNGPGRLKELQAQQSSELLCNVLESPSLPLASSTSPSTSAALFVDYLRRSLAGV